MIFFKIILFKKFFPGYILECQLYSLDPDQDQHFVGPDLGTDWLQGLVWISKLIFVV